MFHATVRQIARLRVPNTAEISTEPDSYHFPLILDRGCRKRLAVVRSELLGQIVNTLTADYKYSRQNRENLSQQVPMQTSLKLKTCFRLFIEFLKSTLNFEYLEKKVSVSKFNYYGNY